MNPAKIPAPGPYEVAIVIDEEGKARGGKGEKWILIKNADGAIATVYPAQNGEATARLLSASPELLKRLKIAGAFVEDQIEILERSYLPEPSESEAEELTETRCMLAEIKITIALAEGL